MGNLTINNGGIIINSDTLPNVDLRYGPYNSIEDANTALNGHKIPGLTVGIKQAGGIIKEYWYQYENGILTLTPTITNEGNTTGINVAGTEVTPDANGTITLPIDTTPKDGSTNIITSGAVYSGLGGKQDNIQDLNQIRSNATTAIQPETLASTLGDIEISRTEQYDIAANLTDRTADIDQQTSEVKALGYKIINPNQPFTSQVVDANTIYEVRDFFDLSGTEQEPATVIIPANCKLRFEGGMLGGEFCTLQGNNTLIESNTVCIQKGIKIAGTWGNDVVYSKWFELISVDDEYIEVEGVQQLNPNPTNNYLQFKQIECFINGTNGCKVEFEDGYYQCRFLDPYTSPEGTHEINGVTYQMFSPFIQYQSKRQTYVYIDSLPYLDINLNGATLKSLQHGYPRWSWIVISNCKKSALHDGIIKGFAAQFDYPEYCNHSRANGVDTYVVSRDYQVGDLVRYHSIECSAFNLTIGNTTGDAMCCGSNTMNSYSDGSLTLIPVYCNSYRVSNCEFSYCGRNGISLHSSNYSTLESLHIHHIGSDRGRGVIGSDGIMGQDPRSGIDIEFEDDLGLTPVMEWSNLYIHDCGETAFGFASISRSTTKSFRATNSVFDGACQTMSYSSVIPIFDNCKFIISHDWTSFKGKSIYQNCEFDLRATYLFAYNTFRNCRFIDNITKEPWTSSDYLFLNDGGGTSDYFENCYFLIKHKSLFKNVTVYDSQFYFDKYSETYKVFSFFCGGTTFTRCNFEALHSTVQDNVSVLDTYNVVFSNVNNTNATTFYYCKFINIKGTESSSPAFTNAYGYIFENCEGALRIRTGESGTTKVGNILINKCNGSTLYINGIYAQPTTIFSIVDSKFTNVYTDANIKDYPDNFVIDGCNIKVSGTSYFKNFTIKNSKVKFPQTNGTYVSYLSGIVIEGSDVTFDNSIFNTSVGNRITLNECIVRGAVSQRLYQGTANDCKFVNAANSGISTQRPTYNLVVGQRYYDTTLNKPIFWNGTSWVDSNGETIGLTVSDTTVLIGAAVNSTASVNVYYAGSTAPTIDVLNPDNTANNWLIATLTGNTLALTLDGTNGANTTTSPRGAKIIITLGTEVVIINVVQAAGSSN